MTTLLCCLAAAGLHLGSAHFGQEPGGPALNSENPGAYVELANGVVLGAYRNSIQRNSAYVGYLLQGPSLGPVQTGLTLGLVTGYSHRVLPGLVPSLYLPLPAAPGQGSVGLRISYLPNVSATRVHTLHLALEYRF